MALTLRLVKGLARFEWSDDDAETVVTIAPDDTDEVMIRKMRRIIALVEGRQAEVFYPEMGRPTVGITASEGPPAANGWAAYKAPGVPDRLKGEVELIKAEEEE